MIVPAHVSLDVELSPGVFMIAHTLISISTINIHSKSMQFPQNLRTCEILFFAEISILAETNRKNVGDCFYLNKQSDLSRVQLSENLGKRQDSEKFGHP